MQQIALFAKLWQPGQVKTRLATAIGPVAAAAVHRACLETLLRRLAPLAAERVLVFTPEAAQAEFAAAVGSLPWRLACQAPGDLGDRLASHTAEAFSQGVERIVLLGADCPHLEVATIEAALAALEHHPAAIAPAEDGGYVLLALRGPTVAPVFAGIPWGSSDVFHLTCARLEETGLSYARLARHFDLDRSEDLQRLRERCSSAGAEAELGYPGDPHLAQLGRRLAEICSPPR